MRTELMVEGTVLAVRPEVNLVVLSIGSRDGVAPGWRFRVSREGIPGMLS
jgi:hypothetical protein